MTDTLANFIQIDGKKITGNIATLSFDIDVTGEPVGTDWLEDLVLRSQVSADRLIERIMRAFAARIGQSWISLRTSDDLTLVALTRND